MVKLWVMTTCSSKELADSLGVTVARVSQLKTQGRFDGCYTTQRSKIFWDLEAATDMYNEVGPIGASNTRKKTEDLDIPSFNESKAKSEHFRAELARLDLETKEQELVEASQVEREAFTNARAVRDALNNIPDRVSSQIGAESDPVVIHKTLSDEIRKALETLTNA